MDPEWAVGPPCLTLSLILAVKQFRGQGIHDPGCPCIEGRDEEIGDPFRESRSFDAAQAAGDGGWETDPGTWTYKARL